MEKPRWRSIAVLFALMLLAVAFFLADRMILRKKEISEKRYCDEGLIELMNSLIEDGVFIIRDSKIAIDERALSSKKMDKKGEDRVRAKVRFLYVKKGEINFDRLSACRTNARDTSDEFVNRGRFLDKNGVVLARNATEGKHRKDRREYTHGIEFYPVIGHSHVVFGKRNLEKAMDNYLTGSFRTPISMTDDPLKKIRYGDDIVLTLNTNVQLLAYKLMSPYKGAACVLDIRTGEIIMAVSTPSFDPNINEGNIWRDAFSEKEKRLYENRVFEAIYPPGSTFKVVVASQWLEKGDEKFSIICTEDKSNRYGISDDHPHGRVDLNKGFVKSCNKFFSEAGVQSGYDLVKKAELFGFNKNISLVPQLPDIAYFAEKSRAFSWRDPQTGKMNSYKEIDFKRNPRIVAQCSIGQNLSMATPLQMAMIASVIANKGVVLNPYIVKSITTHQGQKVFNGKPVIMGRAVQTAHAERVKNFMKLVMTEGTGAGVKKLYLEGGKYTTTPQSKDAAVIVKVAGKTGTAQVGDADSDHKPHSWFIGFAPADKPRFAIAVIAENQGFGSLTAAPLAVEILAEALNSETVIKR